MGNAGTHPTKPANSRDRIRELEEETQVVEELVRNVEAFSQSSDPVGGFLKLRTTLETKFDQRGKEITKRRQRIPYFLGDLKANSIDVLHASEVSCGSQMDSNGNNNHSDMSPGAECLSTIIKLHRKYLVVVEGVTSVLQPPPTPAHDNNVGDSAGGDSSLAAGNDVGRSSFRYVGASFAVVDREFKDLLNKELKMDIPFCDFKSPTGISILKDWHRNPFDASSALGPATDRQSLVADIQSIEALISSRLNSKHLNEEKAKSIRRSFRRIDVFMSSKSDPCENLSETVDKYKAFSRMWVQRIGEEIAFLCELLEKYTEAIQIHDTVNGSQEVGTNSGQCDYDRIESTTTSWTLLRVVRAMLYMKSGPQAEQGGQNIIVLNSPASASKRNGGLGKVRQAKANSQSVKCVGNPQSNVRHAEPPSPRDVSDEFDLEVKDHVTKIRFIGACGLLNLYHHVLLH